MKQLDLDAERATRFCDWIGRVAMGSESQRTVADEHGRETRAGVPASRKPYDLKFPVPPVASRSMGAAPETRACAMLAGRASHLRDRGAIRRREGRHDVANYLRTFACGRARCLNRRDLTFFHPDVTRVDRNVTGVGAIDSRN